MYNFVRIQIKKVEEMIFFFNVGCVELTTGFKTIRRSLCGVSVKNIHVKLLFPRKYKSKPHFGVLLVHISHPCNYQKKKW